MDPGTYAINTLIIGVYSASKINYLISVKETSEKPCLNLCSDNGVCNRGTCSCDQNFIGKDCQTYASELSLDVDQQFVVSGKSKRYLFYDFKNDENRIDVDISVNDSSNDREIIVYTKPYSKNSTTLPSENEYYNKMTGTNIKFTLENNDGDKFFITIENEISGQTSFRIALKKPSGDDGNKATLYMIIGISSGLFLVVLTLVLYIKFKKNTRNLPIDADKARAIDISQIEAHYPETAYEHKDDDMPCSICLENFVINEMVRKLTCDHMYHKKCIDE